MIVHARKLLRSEQMAGLVGQIHVQTDQIGSGNRLVQRRNHLDAGWHRNMPGASARMSSLLNLADLSRDARLPHTTLTRYLSLLETVFLVHRLPAWSPNLGKRLVKAPKLHLVDTGLACHLIGADARRLSEDRALFGRLLETFVVGELRKQVSWTDRQTTLYHFRTATGSEADVVLEKADGTVAALEVKASATVGAADFAALQLLRDQLGRRFRAGAVLYLGEHVLPFGDKLWLLPVSALWAP